MVIAPSLHGGGAERVMVHLLNHLDRARFTPHLALGRAVGPFLRDLRGDVPVIDLQAPRSRHAVWPIVRAVREVRPHVVLSTCMNIASALARPFFPRGTRLLLREGNSISAFLDEVARDSPARSAAYRALYRGLPSMADRVICQSDFMVDDMVDNLGVSRSRLTRIYNPVDLEKVRRLAAEAADPFAGEGPHLLTVGGLYWRKGHDVLLRAMPAVRAAHPGVTLTVLGEGEERQRLEALRDELGLRDVVHLAGFEANPYRVMARADLFVSPSRYEGFANVIVEALALGTPVVATDCPSSNREVIEEGINGFLAPVDDPAGLATTLDRALRGRADLDRAAIARRCEDRFALQRILPQYEALL